MESRSIEYRHPKLEESFSFTSSYDFNSSSSFLFFSDNEDIDVDDADSYIEIALGPHQNNKYEDDDEMELRISFSSSIPLPKTTESYDSLTSSSFTFSSSFSESQRNTEVESTQPCDCKLLEKTFKNKLQFPVVNRFVNTFISSFRLTSPEIDFGDISSADNHHLDLVPTSNSRKKASKIATTTINSTGSMMNFFVKFRALKLRTLLASFLKANSQTNSRRYKGKKTEESFRTNCRNLIKPVDKESAAERKQLKGERSRMLEMNLDAIKGYVLETMSVTSLGRRDRRTESCPVSSKSSPIHQRFLSESYKMSATDNSIQAAIAHCKRSCVSKV